MPLLLAAIFLVSGASALVYEVAWVRMLAATLGASSYTIGTVLAAYMGGLALGARWVGKRADRDSRPLLTYAKLELGIAVAALLVPLAFAAMPFLNRAVYGALEGKLWALTAVRCGMAFVVLLVPTALMGATFPAMASAAASEGGKGWRVGLVYGANTLGAVAGVFIAGFWLIGSVGLRGTTWIAAIGNVAAALAAWVIASQVKPRTMIPDPDAAAAVEEESPVPDQRLALAAAAAAGFVSLGFEVLWTRMFAVLFASITYSFAMMLAVFLLGLALGAPVAGWISDRVKRSRLELVGVLQLAVGVTALAAYLVFPHLQTRTGSIATAFGGPTWPQYLRSLTTDAAKVMLLPSFLMGAILPVCARILAQGPVAGMAGRLGRVYAANTVGAMLGSLVTGFIFIPLFHPIPVLTNAFAQVTVTLALLSTAAGAALVFRGGTWSPLNRWLVTGVAAFAVGLLVLTGPFKDNVVLDKSGIQKPGMARLWYEEGPSLTVTVFESEKTRDRMMYTDAFNVAGTGFTYEYMRMIGHLPMLLRPEAKSACVVGLGTGTTAGALSLWDSLDQIDIVELCPEIARGTKYFGKANRGLMDKIDGKRIRLIYDDGKAYLRSTRKSYDVIVAEPLNPHMTGASSLYSKEFYEAARDRLTDDGIVTQWIPLTGVKPEDFRSLFHTFVQVFPEASVWYFQEAILVTGQKTKFSIRWAPFKAALDRMQTQMELLPLGLDEIYTILGCFMCGPSAVANYARYDATITDDLPTIEYFHSGQPVAFAERENLDGLAQHREMILAYVSFAGLDPKVIKWQQSYFSMVSTIHFRARGLYIEGRKLEMSADRAGAAGDTRTLGALQSQALEKFKAAANTAPGDKYIERYIKRYDKKEAEIAEALTGKEIETIVRLIHSPSAGDKVAACEKLRKYADWRGGGIIGPLLKDPDPQVRYAAVRALGPMGHDEALHRFDKPDSDCALLLKEVLSSPRETKEVKSAAINSLEEIGNKGASELLVVFILGGAHPQAGDDDPEIRAAAVAALRGIGTEESLGYLLFVLTDPDRGVRGEAVTSLANCGDPWVIPGLLEALNDVDPAIRSVASEGLRRITKLGEKWSDKATAEERKAAEEEWRGFYDAWEAQRHWARQLAGMTYDELESRIDALMLKRPAEQQAKWIEVRDAFAKFRDKIATPKPTADLLTAASLPLLKATLDDPHLWFALVFFEQTTGLSRGVIPPDRMSMHNK